MPNADFAKNENPKNDNWSRYFHENTLKIAWSVMLFLGGLLVLIYFGHIGFLPEIDLSNAIALLASMALIGMFIVFFFSGALIFPGVLLKSFVSYGFLLESIDKQIISPAQGKPKPTQLDLSRISAAAALAAAFLQVGALIFSTATKFASNFYLHLFFLALSLLFLSFLWFLFKRSRENIADSSKVRHQGNCWKFSILLLFWVVIGIVPSLPFFLVYRGPDDWTAWLSLGMWLFWVGLSNGMWGFEKQKVKWWLVGCIGLSSLYVFVFFISNPSFISVSAVRFLGLGSVENVRMVVNKNGCRAISLLAGEKSCHTKENAELFVTKKVTLQSRIGSQYLIEVRSVSGEMLRVVLDKKDVISWASSPLKQSRNEDGGR
ncbi:hypothetical protein [Laribacter hongkongensis]|uniref:hypothetical protein n=1 Tax=Laribacter hongkongensis TaxID=168471 RepID=UPI00117C7975|nr:hypothetical protein [Laribacter hongkongensis]